MVLGPTDIDYVRELVRKRSAIVLTDDKRYLLETRLIALARREGYESVDLLVQRLRGGANGLQEKVIDAMTTNETSFFRDTHPFEAIRNLILPELMKRRVARKRIDVWCAASSTGQEPYSLAMLVRDHFPSLLNWEFRILATDLSTEVLARARAGRFREVEVGRGLPPELLRKHFRSVQGEWEISPEVRRMVEFRQLNLIEPFPSMPPPDLVLIRNVLIYFDVATKRDIFRRIRRIMAPDGYMLLGGSETTLQVDDGFERIQADKVPIYRRKLT
jgi:chemotaxis protein methyltransferase CheR